MDLIERWQQTWNGLGLDAPDGVIERLLSAYREPHRAYHTTQHLEECFRQLDVCPTDPREPGLLELALWFHDAIYDTKAGDNEAQSASLARENLAALSADALDRIEQLILVTQHNGAPSTSDQELLLDIDLSILGASEARFEQYEVQVRKEYEWVPEDAYREARGRILREFDARSPLFLTPYFETQLESRAHQNLRRSLARLEVGG